MSKDGGERDMYSRARIAFYIFWICGIIGVLVDTGDALRVFLGAPNCFRYLDPFTALLIFTGICIARSLGNRRSSP